MLAQYPRPIWTGVAGDAAAAAGAAASSSGATTSAATILTLPTIPSSAPPGWTVGTLTAVANSASAQGSGLTFSLVDGPTSAAPFVLSATTGALTLGGFPPLTPGVYEVEAAGGSSVLVVKAAREWIPRAPSVAAGVLARGASGADAPRLADTSWPFVLALLLLCGEWLARRAVGQR